jgi:hypothetical protein
LKAANGSIISSKPAAPAAAQTADQPKETAANNS